MTFNEYVELISDLMSGDLKNPDRVMQANEKLYEALVDDRKQKIHPSSALVDAEDRISRLEAEGVIDRGSRRGLDRD